MLCFAKILQCCFTATLGRSEEEEGGGTGGEGGGLPSAPSPLTQIVPNSASIYSVFHSVNYNSVGPVRIKDLQPRGATVRDTRNGEEFLEGFENLRTI